MAASWLFVSIQSKVIQTSQVMAASWLFVLKEAFKAKEFWNRRHPLTK